VDGGRSAFGQEVSNLDSASLQCRMVEVYGGVDDADANILGAHSYVGLPANDCRTVASLRVAASDAGLPDAVRSCQVFFLLPGGVMVGTVCVVEAKLASRELSA